MQLDWLSTNRIFAQSYSVGRETKRADEKLLECFEGEKTERFSRFIAFLVRLLNTKCRRNCVFCDTIFVECTLEYGKEYCMQT